MEEFARSMEQRSNYAVVKDAQIKLTKEECAGGMGQRSNDALIQDALIRLREEDFASSTVQSTNDAAVKVAQAKLSKEEYAGGMGQTVATFTKNLLLLHRALDPNSIRLLLLNPLSVLQQATIACLEW
jgi:hypothetical protein